MQFEIGVVGGGQLARMSIQAAQRMGIRCLSLDKGADSPAAQIAPSIDASLNDVAGLTELLANCERVTLENEFVPAAILREACAAAERDESAILPGIDCLATVQDKLLQREAYHRAGVSSPRAAPISDDGAVAVAKIGFPMVLKARFGGYDGKGTKFARTMEEFEENRIHWQDGGWLAEEFVAFEREVAVMVVRTPTSLTCFPTMETVQSNHVCDVVFPAESVDASEIAAEAVKAVGGFGLFGVELFESAGGALSVNEIAPRPHNSGHYSMDWGGLSQFDAHIRTVMGFELGDLVGQKTCMANLLGQVSTHNVLAAMQKTLELSPDARIHWYGKTQSRPGRKMGHLNLPGFESVEQVRHMRDTFYQAWAADS